MRICRGLIILLAAAYYLLQYRSVGIRILVILIIAFGILSFIFGVLTLVFGILSFIFRIFSLIFGILSFIFGIA